MTYEQRAYHDGWNDGYYQRPIDTLRAEHDADYVKGHDDGERDWALVCNRPMAEPRCEHCGIPKREHLMPGMCAADWALSRWEVIL